MIPIRRKENLSSLAQFIATEFSKGTITSLQEIVKAEDISLYYDHYEDSFDGMLLCDNTDFHIHVNLDKGNQHNSKRGRFTLAHELSHYFIDEHRIGLKEGKLAPHQSIHELERKNLIEEEADYFAGCLLMPEDQFRKQSGGKKFSLEIIKNLSESFQSSMLSTVIRFAEIGTHDVMAIISEKNKVKWYTQSSDFPKWSFKFKVGDQLPPTTVAGEFFTKKDSKYTGIEDISSTDWFYPKGFRADDKMHEQCYYSDVYGYVISIIWLE